MLKLLISLVFILLFTIQGLAQQKSKEVSKSETLVLEMNKKRWKAPIRKKKGASIKKIVIKGKFDDEKWQQVYNRVIINNNITELEFNNNELIDIPKGITNIKTLEQIGFNKNIWIDWEAVIDSIKNLPNLKQLQIEVLSEADMPANLSELPKNVVVKSKQASQAQQGKNISLRKGPVENKSFAIEKKSGSKKIAQQLNSHVKPPIKNADIKREVVTIDMKVPNKIKATDGTIIKVPENAFVTKTGKPYTGAAKISYRSFNNPVDFLLSGIPMNFDSAGESIPFISSGMFELLAFDKKNNPLQLAENKKIDVNFKPALKDSSANFYAFNDSTGSWVQQKTASQLNRARFKGTQAYCEYKNIVYGNSPIFDSTLFADRFTDNKYVYNFRYKNNDHFSFYHVLGNSGVDARYPHRKDHPSNLLRLFRFVSKGYSKDSSYKFKCKVNLITHPELTELARYTLIIPDIPRSEAIKIKSTFISRKKYNDVRIEANGSGINFVLKDTLGTHAFNNVMLGKYNSFKKTYTIVDDKKVSGIMNRYSKNLARREKHFNRAIKKGKVSLNTYFKYRAQGLEEYAWNVAKKYMNEEEKALSFSDWEKYFYKQQRYDGYSNMPEAQANLFYTLSVMKMGIYNCDQIRRISAPRTDYIAISDLPKEEKPYVAYVICKDRNSVFSYYPGLLGLSITYPGSEKANTAVVFANNKGQLLVSDFEDFKNYRASIKFGKGEIKTRTITSSDDVAGEIARVLEAK